MIIQVEIDAAAPWEEIAKQVQAKIAAAPFTALEGRLAALEARLGLKSGTGVERYLWPSQPAHAAPPSK